MPLVRLPRAELVGTASYVWDSNALDWIKATGSSTSSGTVSVDNFPATQAVTGPLTNTELRASPIEVEISGAPSDFVVTGLNEFQFGEQTIASGASVTVVSRLFGTEYKLRRVSATGENVGIYSVLFNGTPVDKKRSTYTDFNCLFDYETGITIPAGTTVTIEVENAGASAADFSAQILFSAR